MHKDDLILKLAQLERDNKKLRRINEVLIERVESSGSQVANPYSAFEHAVVLAEQVRERTEALNVALSDLKASNRALQSANQQAATSHQRLIDAIDSISDAFVLFDADRRIVLFNDKFQSIWNETGVEIQTGTTIQDISHLAYESGLIVEAYGEESSRNKVFLLGNGKWFQMSERPTMDGGLVVLYTDITELKNNETAIRERALAQKSKLLQTTVDNLSQGVALVNYEGILELWNDRFLELTGVEEALVVPHPPFAALMLSHENILQHALTAAQQGEVLAAEQLMFNGKVIEVRTHPMPAGGFVNTYTDITERHRYAETLRESEQWIRLITDNVPAMICYVGQDGRFQFTNKVYDEWYGWPRGALNGELISQLHGPAEMATLAPYFQRALAGESVTFEMNEHNLKGEERTLFKAYVPNIDVNGNVLGCFVMIRDITLRIRTAEELKQAYQMMEQRVKERTSELMLLNEQLRSEITERTEAEARLREANQEAQQANLSKTKFLAAVSHDLLQPLNAARLFTSALSEQSMESRNHSLVQSVSSSLEDVESLLSTLVDISKLDAGVVVPDVISFKLDALLQNIAREYQQVAESEGLQLRFIPCSAVICSDSQLLARILRNFLSNAVRYTDKGKILLGCRRQKDSLLVQVWDSGEGIPEAKQQEVFQEFKRLNHTHSGQDKGLGLGLAIVDKISRVLGHRVDLRSWEGKGSVFSVEVPYGKPLPFEGAFHGPNLPQRLEHLQGATVWVIDNDQAICQGMETLLSGWGCQVITALSLPHLMDQVDPATSPVDLIVADYHLDNGENGVNAVSAVRAMMTRAVPVLMITANYNKELKQEIRELGYMLMNKPVKPLKLKTTLIHMLEVGA
ncbi:MAG: NahK/ErcS family hybrid sensor histidine kinase/response regulator [Pontibacterium sp.]